MPLYKRKPFPLVEPPQDLESTELVFQVRFTKEIFRDYQEYLNQINLYRQRVWTCKVTAKTNLTYEEALVSESRATEKVQQFPKELMGHVLHMIQYNALPVKHVPRAYMRHNSCSLNNRDQDKNKSKMQAKLKRDHELNYPDDQGGTLTLKDLVTTINKNLQERLFEGLELFGRKDKSIFLCKILKILEDAGKIHYEVCWMDNDKNVTGSSVVTADDLIRKKLPFGREVLKSFIRESTSRSTPWVVHDKLARRHGVRTSPPQDLVDKFSNCRKNILSGKDAEQVEIDKQKRKKQETDNSESLTRTKKTKRDDDEPIKYPIDDLLVQPGADDPIFTDRPPPSRDFGVPMDCVGDLLMVWDFCSSFSRLLNLWPFSFEDFENAICHKDANLILIVESHSAILRLLIKDEGEYFTALQKKKRKSKITLVTWTEYLCDFLEMEDIPEFSTCIATVRRGHYGLLDPHAKVGILRELVAKALTTNVVREQLDEYIEQRTALAARKRGVAIEEARKRREEKLLKNSDSKEVIKQQSLENGGDNMNINENDCSKKQNGSVTKERNNEILQYKRKKLSGNRDDKDVNSSSGMVKQKMGVKVTTDYEKESSCEEEQKDAARQRNCKKNEVQEKRSEEQTKEVLEREMEKRFIRTNSMGKDKNYNRYWFFQRDGRIFVESSDSNLWGYYTTKEELDALIGSLNLKGERERALYRQLQKCHHRICSALQKRSKDIASKIEMEEAVVRRSTRVRAPPKDSPVTAFLRYINKWKDD